MTHSHEPINVEQLAEEIDARLQTLSSLKVESVRAVRREFSRRIAGASPQEVIALALRLLDRHRFVAYELVHHHHAHSPDRWWRRAALVSTVPLNLKARGGHGDTARTLLICRLLIADRDDMVVKAMSWALRELSRHDPQVVRVFLAEYEGRFAARVVREVQHKLTTGLKNPRRTSP